MEMGEEIIKDFLSLVTSSKSKAVMILVVNDDIHRSYLNKYD